MVTVSKRYDPFIFGRGGEEMEGHWHPGKAETFPEIVPGVTTPLGIAAYTGVLLTHRERQLGGDVRHRA